MASRKRLRARSVRWNRVAAVIFYLHDGRGRRAKFTAEPRLAAAAASTRCLAATMRCKVRVNLHASLRPQHMADNCGLRGRAPFMLRYFLYTTTAPCGPAGHTDDGRGCLILPIFIFLETAPSTPSIVNQSFTLRSITTHDRPRFFASASFIHIPALSLTRSSQDLYTHRNIQQQGSVSWLYRCTLY